MSWLKLVSSSRPEPVESVAGSHHMYNDPLPPWGRTSVGLIDPDSSASGLVLDSERYRRPAWAVLAETAKVMARTIKASLNHFMFSFHFLNRDKLEDMKISYTCLCDLSARWPPEPRGLPTNQARYGAWRYYV